MKLPAFQFYPADWRKDPGVQSLSYHDRGVWFEILCLMHESEQRGKLLLNGAPMPDEALARLLGLDKQILTKTLTTLLSYGVASRDEESGALVNRRMVKDEELRKIRREAGKMGGNPVLLNQNPNQNPEPGLTKNQPLHTSSSFTPSGDDARARDPAPPERPLDAADPFKHPAVLAYNRALRPQPALTIGQCEQIAAAVSDMGVWGEVLMIFQGNAYQPRHAWNAIDRYRKEVEKKKTEKRLQSVDETPEQKQQRLSKIVEQRKAQVS